MKARAVVLLITSVVLAATAAASEWQTLASIEAAARQFVRSQFGSEAEIAISTRALDQRLRLQRCPNPLRADAPRGLRNGRGTVRVRCEGPKPWKLFVPVSLTRQVSVVVARRALVAGTVVAAADLAVEQWQESLLPTGFISDPADLAGLTIRRAVAAGNPLTNRTVQAGRLVRRGQRVALFTQRGGIFVKSDGVAMADAGRNQRLAVKTRGGRIVAGIVRDATTVEIEH